MFGVFPLSIPEQLFQLLSCRVLAGIRAFPLPLPPNEIEILAKIRQMLVRDRIGPPVLALMRHPRLVAHAIQAHLQVRPAPMTCFRPPGQTSDRVLPSALMTMPR